MVPEADQFIMNGDSEFAQKEVFRFVERLVNNVNLKVNRGQIDEKK